MDKREITVKDILNWIKKFEALKSEGAKVVHVKSLLERSADYIIGNNDEEIDVNGDLVNDMVAVSRGAKNALRDEQRQKAGIYDYNAE